MFRDIPQASLQDDRPIEQDDRWGLIGSFFSSHGFVQQQIDSMNRFMTVDLPAIITQTPPIRLYPSKNRFQSRHMKHRRYFYEISFDSVHLGRPMITDANNNSVSLFPQDARERDLNYSAALYVRATTRRIESDGDDGVRESVKREWVYIGQFPIMVGSNHCWLADETLDRDVAQMRECLYDQGAYFIGRGREKVLVAQEHIRFNRIFVFEKRRSTGVVLVCEVRSCYNAHLRNVHPVSITILGTRISDRGLRSTRGVPMNVRIPYANQPISVPVIFKALGVLDDGDIVYCVAQREDDEAIASLLRRPLEEAAHLKTREDALYVLGKCLNIPNRNTKDPRAGRIALALRSMSRVFLPHMASNLDNTYEERMNKALFFGHQVRKLFNVYLGRTASANDRDHYTNKRLDMPGSLFGLLFTQNFQKMKKEARKYLERCIEHGKPPNLSQAIKSKTITQGLRYALSTGKWPNYQVVKINAGVSQELNRMTFGATLSHLRRVNTPIDKKTGKLTKPRQLHATQQFLLCAVETPEGAPCGVLKNFALMCAVSVGVEAGPILDVIRSTPRMVLPMKLIDRAWVAENQASTWQKVFLNGEWVGLVPDALGLTNNLRTLRRQGELSAEMSVAYKTEMRELHISTEGGRPMHPALVVRRNKDGFFELALRKYHIAKLKYSAVTNYGWSDLLDDGVVEWLDCEELETCMMAMEPSDLAKQNQLLRENGWLTAQGKEAPIHIIEYTHCEIHPAMQLGVCGSIIPLPDHNQSPRNVYQCVDSQTRVTMSDGTTRSIASLNCGDVVKTFNPTTGILGQSKVIAHETRVPLRPVYELKTTSGRSVRATEDHKFLTAQGWKQVSDVQPGDLVGIVPAQNIEREHNSNGHVVLDENTLQVAIDKRLLCKHKTELYAIGLLPLQADDDRLPCIARMFGFLLAAGLAGIYAKGSRIQADFNSSTDFEAFEQDVVALGFAPCVATERIGNRSGTVHHTWHVTHGGSIASFFIGLGLPTGKRTVQETLPVPRWIMTGSIKVKREFLAGLHGGDGCCIRANNLKHSVNFVCAALRMAQVPKFVKSLRNFMQHVQVLLHQFGIKAKVVQEPDDYGKLNVGVKIADAQKNLVTFFTRIGYRYAQTKHMASAQVVEYIQCVNKVLLADWNTTVKARGNLLFVPVASKTLCTDACLVSDVTVDSFHHSFVADGWASSNCAMGKQALGIATTNYHYRFDSIANLLYYPQRPLVTTRINEMMRSSELPSGQNIMVAIMCSDGYDIEDATIMNQSSVDRGMFRSVQLRTYYEEAKKNHAHGKETFENPKKDTETDITHMQQGNYDKLSDAGVVLPGTRVAEHDIIIAKTVTPKVNNYRRKTRQNALGAVLGQDGGVEEERKKRDKSVVVGKNEHGVVDRILKTVTPKVETIKLRTRQMRIPEFGDKFSSRHGQKGTVGRMVRAEDMPFTSQGIVPDLIINPHAFTSRMTVGHLLDMLFGKLGAATGRQQDGTVFDHKSVEAVAEALHRCRHQRYGNEVLYDGRSGERLPDTVFIGPIYYQRLKHMVQDKIHARARGATRMMTRQPTVGRRRDGGFRFGEMERDCMIAHGGAANLRERLFTQSDPYTTYICTNCGQIAIHNTKTDDRWCNQCQTHKVDVVPVAMPYAFKLLKQELLALNIAARLVVPPSSQPHDENATL